MLYPSGIGSPTFRTILHSIYVHIPCIRLEIINSRDKDGKFSYCSTRANECSSTVRDVHVFNISYSIFVLDSICLGFSFFLQTFLVYYWMNGSWIYWLFLSFLRWMCHSRCNMIGWRLFCLYHTQFRFRMVLCGL